MTGLALGCDLGLRAAPRAPAGRRTAGGANTAPQPELESDTLIRDLPDAVMLTDTAGVILYVNPAFETMTGHAARDAVGRTPAILRSGRTSEGSYRELWDTLNAGQPYRGVLLNRRRNGELFHAEQLIRPLRDAQGRITRFLACARDVSELMDEMQRLVRAATHDALTGLPNRTVFLDRLEQALALSQRTGTACAIAVLDVDHFKAVNDTFGHAAGDVLLRAVGQRLLGCVRHVDTVARIGGDEFALLLHGAQDDAAVGRVLRHILRAFARPVQGADGPLQVSLSIGACIVRTDAADASTLLRRADAAMYRVKRLGGRGFLLHAGDAAPARP